MGDDEVVSPEVAKGGTCAGRMGEVTWIGQGNSR